jgi:hypothetical protein
MNCKMRLHVLRYCCVSHTLIHKALACCHYGPFIPQPRQCNGHLLLVTAAYAIRDDIDLVSSSEEIDGGLCNADVALNANNDAREWAGDIKTVERFLDFGCSKMC